MQHQLIGINLIPQCCPFLNLCSVGSFGMFHFNIRGVPGLALQKYVLPRIAAETIKKTLIGQTQKIRLTYKLQSKFCSLESIARRQNVRRPFNFDNISLVPCPDILFYCVFRHLASSTIDLKKITIEKQENIHTCLRSTQKPKSSNYSFFGSSMLCGSWWQYTFGPHFTRKFL